jgi:2-polyprenyl-3-methyl-5-hydroxy-6-metoxy-1,4-benzoquinol methylase
MESNSFVHEVYRRMQGRYLEETLPLNFEEISQSERVKQAVNDYRSLLPHDKDAPILDVGFGTGWFLAACVLLGYTNLYGAEFGFQGDSHLLSWPNKIRRIDQIHLNIGTYLEDKREKFDFIHMSHVIEHVPKHSLFYITDALYWALKTNGTLMLRCPNMEGPSALTAHFITLGHEYGFTTSNLRSLLELSNFDDINFKIFYAYAPTQQQKIGNVLRKFLSKIRSVKHRIHHGEYLDEVRLGVELIVSSKKNSRPPLFNKMYI